MISDEDKERVRQATDIVQLVGETVELRQSLINIYEMQVEQQQLPDLKLRVRCSRGTYIRSLADELGRACQSGAHLTSLRRTRSGGFMVENGWQLTDFLEQLAMLEEKKLNEAETK